MNIYEHENKNAKYQLALSNKIDKPIPSSIPS